MKKLTLILAVIVDDNKQAAQDLAERLGDFDEVEIGGIALNGMDGLALVGQVCCCCFLHSY